VVAAANVPLTPWLAARVSGVRDQRDSFTRNIGGPSQPGDVNLTAWRADVLFEPFERWQTNFRFEDFLNDTTYNAVKRRGDPNRDPFVINEDAVSYLRQDGYRSEIETRYDLLDWLQVRGNVNYQYSLNRDIGDGDRNTNPSTPALGPDRGRLGFTQTIFNTLVSEIDLITTGESDVQWVLGAFYMDETVPVVLRTYGNDRVVPTTPPTSHTRTKAFNLSRSAFGQANWRFMPQWELIVGARYSKDSQIYQRLLGTGAGTTGVARSDVWTGRVAVNYDVNETTMVYASVARGYKAGGVNLVPGDASFKPETNLVEELGFKTTVMEGALRVNGALFFSQYEDLQLSSLTPARLPTTLNVPNSKSGGAELEVEAILGRFRLNGGLAYLDAETDSAAMILNNTIRPSALQPVAPGTRLPFSPELTFNGGVETDIEVMGGTLTPRLQVSHISEQFASVFQNANSRVPERTLLDARLSFDHGGPWRVEAFVNNLTDEVYIASQVQDASSTNGGIIYGAPRLYGLRFVVRAD
jgi:iron complex outermembrane receptor protein